MNPSFSQPPRVLGDRLGGEIGGGSAYFYVLNSFLLSLENRAEILFSYVKARLYMEALLSPASADGGRKLWTMGRALPRCEGSVGHIHGGQDTRSLPGLVFLCGVVSVSSSRVQVLEFYL